MPGLFRDPRIRRILLFAQRLISQPHLDVDRVPAILDMATGMQRLWRWLQAIAIAVIAVVAGISAYTLKTAPALFDPVDTFCDLAPSVTFLLVARFGVKRVKASFGQFDVTVEEGRRTWTAPIASFRGLAWYQFTTVTYSRMSRIDRSFGYGEVSTPTVMSHHWIELIHPDAEKTLVLAVSMKDRVMRDLLHRYAKVLNRPVLAEGVAVDAAAHADAAQSGR